jgi:hypothetical protein
MMTAEFDGRRRIDEGITWVGFTLDPGHPPTRSESFIAHGHDTVSAVWDPAATRPSDRPRRWWQAATPER